jgi:predicted ferric reductase
MTWGELVRKLVALVASFASMAGLLVAFLPSPKDLPWWAVTLLVMAFLAFIVLVVLELSDRRHRHVYAHTDAHGIRRYMHQWIEHGGRVAIWTRDMSWAQNPETRQLLIGKARRQELILCLPEVNALAEELVQAGAEVCAYGAGLLESPASRFTITFFGRDGSRVAVGRAEGDTHVIDEFGAGGHPAFHLAADLVTIARALERRQRQ